MSQPEYGEIVVTSRVAGQMPVVESAPKSALVSVGLLRAFRGMHLPGPDTIHVGLRADGSDVLYRIVGWDAAAKALIVALYAPDSVATDPRVQEG